MGSYFGEGPAVIAFDAMREFQKIRQYVLRVYKPVAMVWLTWIWTLYKMLLNETVLSVSLVLFSTSILGSEENNFQLKIIKTAEI